MSMYCEEAQPRDYNSVASPSPTNGAAPYLALEITNRLLSFFIILWRICLLAVVLIHGHNDVSQKDNVCQERRDATRPS